MFIGGGGGSSKEHDPDFDGLFQSLHEMTAPRLLDFLTSIKEVLSKKPTLVGWATRSSISASRRAALEEYMEKGSLKMVGEVEQRVHSLRSSRVTPLVAELVTLLRIINQSMEVLRPVHQSRLAPLGEEVESLCVGTFVATLENFKKDYRRHMGVIAATRCDLPLYEAAVRHYPPVVAGKTLSREEVEAWVKLFQQYQTESQHEFASLYGSHMSIFGRVEEMSRNISLMASVDLIKKVAANIDGLSSTADHIIAHLRSALSEMESAHGFVNERIANCRLAACGTVARLVLRAPPPQYPARVPNVDIQSAYTKVDSVEEYTAYVEDARRRFIGELPMRVPNVAPCGGWLSIGTIEGYLTFSQAMEEYINAIGLTQKVMLSLLKSALTLSERVRVNGTSSLLSSGEASTSTSTTSALSSSPTATGAAATTATTATATSRTASTSTSTSMSPTAAFTSALFGVTTTTSPKAPRGGSLPLGRAQPATVTAPTVPLKLPPSVAIFGMPPRRGVDESNRGGLAVVEVTLPPSPSFATRRAGEVQWQGGSVYVPAVPTFPQELD